MDTEGTVLEEGEEVEAETETPESGEVEHESVEDSVRLAIEELKNEAGEENQEEGAPEIASEPSQDTTKPGEVAKPGQPETPEADPELNPPERLNAQEKAIFKRSSPAMKRIFHRAIKDLESRSHKAFHTEKAAIETKAAKYRALDDIIDPYLPTFAKIGHTKESAIAELLEIHKGLSNPTTRKAEFEKLGNRIGYDWTQRGGTQTEGQENDPIAGHPLVKQLIDENKELRKKIDPVYNQVQNQTNQVQQSAIQNMNQQFAAVGQEVDSLGRLAYPKLTQDPAYFERLRPLVVGLMQSDPDLDFGSALKEAYNRTEKRNGYLTNQNPAKPSPQKQTNRIISPPLSVRGKTASVSDLPAYDDDVKPGETPEESARIAVERLSRGVH